VDITVGSTDQANAAFALNGTLQTVTELNDPSTYFTSSTAASTVAQFVVFASSDGYKLLNNRGATKLVQTLYSGR
jgi:hypothetical protein